MNRGAEIVCMLLGFCAALLLPGVGLGDGSLKSKAVAFCLVLAALMFSRDVLVNCRSLARLIVNRWIESMLPIPPQGSADSAMPTGTPLREDDARSPESAPEEGRPQGVLVEGSRAWALLAMTLLSPLMALAVAVTYLPAVLWLIAWASPQVDVAFEVAGLWSAVIGGWVIGAVRLVSSLILAVFGIGVVMNPNLVWTHQTTPRE
jgi:hypothetical protein